MNSKKHILQIIGKDRESIHAQDFVDCHAAFEAYLKHIGMLILRLKACKSKPATSYIRKIWIPCSEASIKKLLLTLSNHNINAQNWNRLQNNRPELKALLKILFGYSAKIRNIVVHGNFYKFDEGELFFLITFYQRLFESFEQFFADKFNGNKVLVNTPTQFGAPRGTIEDEAKMKQLLSFSASERPMTFEQAKVLIGEY